MNKKNSDGGYDDTTHSLVSFHEAPASLVALREELIHHSDITDVAQKGSTFEECLGLIALQLDIALDGFYDVEPLCKMLVEALRNRRFHSSEPHKRASGLVDVELIEREGEVEIIKRDRTVETLAPEGSIVTTTKKKKV
jgi:hypothetical protein